MIWYLLLTYLGTRDICDVQIYIWKRSGVHMHRDGAMERGNQQVHTANTEGTSDGTNYLVPWSCPSNLCKYRKVNAWFWSHSMCSIYCTFVNNTNIILVKSYSLELRAEVISRKELGQVRSTYCNLEKKPLSECNRKDENSWIFLLR